MKMQQLVYYTEKPLVRFLTDQQILLKSTSFYNESEKEIVMQFVKNVFKRVANDTI